MGESRAERWVSRIVQAILIGIVVGGLVSAFDWIMETRLEITRVEAQMLGEVGEVRTQVGRIQEAVRLIGEEELRRVRKDVQVPILNPEQVELREGLTAFLDSLETTPTVVE